MSEPAKKPRAKKQSRPAPDRSDKTAIGQRIISDKLDAGGRTISPEHDELRLQAQALWESSPKSTLKVVAEQLSLPEKTVRGWMRKYGWRRVQSKDLPELAQKAADTYKQNLSTLGPEITLEQRDEAASKAIEVTAGEMRAAVIDRHRKEWGSARKLSYEAMQKRDFNLAKLAKISAETLLLVQSGERKAWGLDVKEGDKGQEEDDDPIVIEREQA